MERDPQSIPMPGTPRGHSVVDLLPVGVFVLSSDGSLQHLNAAGLAVVEAESLDQVRGKPFLPVVAPEFRSAFLDLQQNVLAGGVGTLEFQITGLRGTRKWIECSAVPLRDTETAGPSLLAVCRDTTERVQQEGRSRYFQKMDAITTLTSGIAHDFNNILTSIVGYANVLKMKLQADDVLRSFASQILASTERATALTKNLLAFGHKQILSLEPVKLAEVVRMAIDDAAPQLGAGVTAEFTDHTPPDTTIMVDPPQLVQALRHILLNARDAMPGGGAIRITAEIMELEDTFISVHGYGTKGAYAVIAFTDTGAGMDDKTRHKAFEPFFTTRETGKGLGLGLAIVYGTVKSHRGFVNIYSEVGTGTTVRVYLPVSEVRRSADDSDEDLVPGGHGETILLTEDDGHIRNIMASVLEQFGYAVVPAVSGENALEIFEEDPGRIDLVMLDAVLPGMTGREFHDILMQRRPGMRVLFTSGYPRDLLTEKQLVPEGVPFISKPVSPRDLLRKLREVLEQ